MSNKEKLVLIKNFKNIRNRGKSHEQIIHFDACDYMDSMCLSRDLDVQSDDKEYDVRISFKNANLTASFVNFADAQRLMDDLVLIMQNPNHTFIEIDLLNYETK